ncbi:hypothetical protein E4U21_000684 [Claviceps maximensis]|nr:hypothetical protein E4U21_000684 [Claviceps maximensis]
MERDRDARGRRYDDGEVVRYGAGESWRPTPRGGPPGDRSPRRPRSPGRDRPRSPIRDRLRSPVRERPRSPPPRDRPRSPMRDRPRSPGRDRPRSPGRDRPRSPRARSPRPRSPVIPSSDSYVPGRYPPRRRSRSGGDRFTRRERSRERDSPPRRRERTRSPPPPMRRSPGPPRRSLSRRGSPIREMRFERPRSPPRRDWERDRERDWDRDRIRDRDRGLDRRDERRRSRSPFGRERRDRSPPMKSPLMAPRGGSYRPRSRSLSRGRFGERYQPYRRATPIRESGISSAMTSQPTSEKASPRPSSVKARSPLPSREQSPHRTIASGSASVRGTPRSGPPDPPSASRTPPRGPAALRGAPHPPSSSGPAPAAAAVGGRTLSSAISSPLPPINSARHPPTPSRTDAPSPTNPPSGPRGYVPPSRASYPLRLGGRSAWSQPSSRQMSGMSPSPTAPGGSGGSIPTGPRGSQSAASGGGGGGGGGSSTPTSARPFNPPTGPASQHSSGSGPRQTLGQSLLSTMPPLIPGGKLDPSMTPLVLGVTRDLEPHYRKLRDEEEKLRDDVRSRQERLRKSLYMWDRLERESRAWELRSDLSERSMKNLAGEGMGGAAF